jgi:hypothetical protein
MSTIKYSNDPIAHAQASGKHFENTAKYVKVTPTPASQPSVGEKLGGKNSHDGVKGYAPIDPAAACCTYTGKGGSTRKSEKY